MKSGQSGSHQCPDRRQAGSKLMRSFLGGSKHEHDNSTVPTELLTDAEIDRIAAHLDGLACRLGGLRGAMVDLFLSAAGDIGEILGAAA